MPTPTTLPLEPVGPNPAVAPSLRWGVLAPGGIAALFTRDVIEHTASTVTAVGSRDAGRAREFAHRFDIERAHGSYAELVRDDGVDAVYIASPHSHHYEHAMLAIEAGKHILVEKAFTRNISETQRVFAAASEAKVFAMEAMWSRFLPQFYALRAVLARGVIGEIVHIYAAHGQAASHVPRLARPDLAGGALLDLGVYPISFTHHLLGAPQSVHASGQVTPAGVDATVGITLTYPDAVATLSTTMLSRTNNIAEISGTQGRITLTDPFYGPSTEIWVHRTDADPYVLSTSVEGGFQYEAAEVARCVHAEVAQSPLMPWQDTLEVMATLDEARRQLGVVFPEE